VNVTQSQTLMDNFKVVFLNVSIFFFLHPQIPDFQIVVSKNIVLS